MYTPGLIDGMILQRNDRAQDVDDWFLVDWFDQIANEYNLAAEHERLHGLTKCRSSQPGKYKEDLQSIDTKQGPLAIL